MAASKSYFARTNYRFLSGERDPIPSDSMFELQESDVWSSAARSESPEFRKSAPSSRLSRKAPARRAESGDLAGGAAAASSLPVNIPDWSKILKQDFRDNRKRENDVSDDDDEDDGGDRVPPHEFLARQLARTRIASFSVHEGIGRTLKGRDLSRVRNAIWEKTGFQD